MHTIIVIILIISGLTNMVADVLMVSGAEQGNPNQSNEERVKATPDRHILMSAVIGLLSIMFWLVPIYSLSKIAGTVGTIAFISFAMYVLNIAVFHVMVAYSLLVFKMNPSLEKMVQKYLAPYGASCIVTSLVYTVAMIYLGQTGTLAMSFFHYLTLPLPAMILIQFILGKLLRRIPYFSTISGTFGMMISFVSTMHIMIINQI